MKIVINKCYGGFGLSKKAMERLIELGCQEAIEYKKRYINDALFNDFDHCHLFTYTEERSNPMLIQVVEELGEDAAGQLAELRIVNVPDDVSWYIDDYDGIESIHEEHSSWG